MQMLAGRRMYLYLYIFFYGYFSIAYTTHMATFSIAYTYYVKAIEKVAKEKLNIV